MNLDKLSIFITVIALILPSHAANDPIEGPVKVSEVTFDGGLAVTNDDTTAMPTPHWIDRLNNADPSDDFPDGTPDEDKAQTKPNHVKSYAYSYHTEQKPKVEAIFKWKDGAPPEGRPYSAKGIVIETDNSTFELPKQELEGDTKYNMISATKNVVDAKKIQAYLTANRKVERKVKAGTDMAKNLKPLQIRWTVYDKDNKVVGESNSTHTIYVTRAAPTTTLRQETLFNLSCVMANGIAMVAADQGKSVFDKIWSEFEDRKVKRMDEEYLCYYKNGVKQSEVSDTTDGLLTELNGQCLAWVTLLLDSAKCQALGNLFHIGVAAGGDDAELLMVIKNWSPNLTDPLHIIMPTVYPDTSCSLGNAKYGDLTSDEGLPGQNVSTPYVKIFGSHAICKMGELYYDPSYGTTYQNETDFENKAIFGYGTRWENTLAEPPEPLDIYTRNKDFSIILFAQPLPY
jgi:hypothetical protein